MVVKIRAAEANRGCTKCAVADCIDMVQLAAGDLDRRTGKKVEPVYSNWAQHPNNPMHKGAPVQVPEPAEYATIRLGGGFRLHPNG